MVKQSNHGLSILVDAELTKYKGILLFILAISILFSLTETKGFFANKMVRLSDRPDGNILLSMGFDAALQQLIKQKVIGRRYENKLFENAFYYLLL